jgi:hypothetical protein
MEDLRCAHNNNESRRKGASCICTEHEEGSKVPRVNFLQKLLEKWMRVDWDDFAYQMPDSFPKVIFPRHIVEIHIEIKPRLHPLARVPYRLSGPKLKELR